MTALAFSADGVRLASGCADQKVRLWDAATGALVLTLSGYRGTVTGVAFHPPEARLASASEDGSVRLWDLETGQEVLTLRGQLVHAAAVAFSPDGKRLAAAQSQGLVKVWDAEAAGPAEAKQRQFTWHQREAEGCLANRRWATARGHLDRLLAAEPDEAAFLARRAGALAELGLWEEAVADSARAVARGADPTDPVVWGWRLAWLRILFGEPEEAGRTAAGLLRRHAATAAVLEAYTVARYCSFAPRGTVRPEEVVTVAQRGASLNSGLPLAWETLGLAQYRARDWPRAVAACIKARELPGAAGRPEFVLAMAYWQQGNHEQARRSYEEAAAALEKAPPEMAAALEREELRRLRAEAAALLGVPDPPPPK